MAHIYLDAIPYWPPIKVLLEVEIPTMKYLRHLSGNPSIANNSQNRLSSPDALLLASSQRIAAHTGFTVFILRLPLYIAELTYVIVRELVQSRRPQIVDESY